MFKKIIDKITGKNKKVNSQDLNSIDAVGINIDEEDSGSYENEFSQPSNVINLSDYIKKKKIKSNNISYLHDKNVVKKSEKKVLDKIDLANKKSVSSVLEKEFCLECALSLSDRFKMSAVSNKGDYTYVCCNNCGCVMKLKNTGVLTNTKNILKEVSDAYVLFKMVNIDPSSYSYTRYGEKHRF